MIVAIHQPNYLPWLGFFDKIKKSDCFIFMDNVQYPRRSWVNRVKIKTKGGEKLLTVPLQVRGNYHEIIKNMRIFDEEPWRKKHLLTIEHNYSKAKYYTKFFPEIEKIITGKQERICELNISLTKLVCEIIKLKPSFILGSTLNAEGSGTDLLINMVKAVGGDTYLCGGGASGYQEDEKFTNAGIKLIYQDFKHPEYPQLYGEFIAGLSCIDWIFNTGAKE